jgi:hypothetical protein
MHLFDVTHSIVYTYHLLNASVRLESSYRRYIREYIIVSPIFPYISPWEWFNTNRNTNEMTEYQQQNVTSNKCIHLVFNKSYPETNEHQGRPVSATVIQVSTATCLAHSQIFHGWKFRNVAQVRTLLLWTLEQQLPANKFNVIVRRR